MEVANISSETKEIGSENATPQAKAVLKAHKLHPPNKHGRNQWIFEKSLTPYSIKYALADVLLKQGKSVRDTMMLSGLSVNTVMKVKKGEIKLSDAWVKRIKENESNKYTFLSNLILDSVNENDLKKASLLQKVTSASILMDKRRQRDGEPDLVVNHVSNLDNLMNISQEMGKLMSKLGSVEAEQVIDQPKMVDNQQVSMDQPSEAAQEIKP